MIAVIRPGARLTVALASTLATVAIATGCGGSDLPTRQEFVDSLQAQSDDLITEDVASCMYDALSEDEEATKAVADWQEGDDVPAELAESALDCLNDPG